jgi:hypothetical protein
MFSSLRLHLLIPMPALAKMKAADPASQTHLWLPARLRALKSDDSAEDFSRNVPRGVAMKLLGHTQGVNCVRWSKPNGE